MRIAPTGGARGGTGGFGSTATAHTVSGRNNSTGYDRGIPPSAIVEVCELRDIVCQEDVEESASDFCINKSLSVPTEVSVNGKSVNCREADVVALFAGAPVKVAQTRIMPNKSFGFAEFTTTQDGLLAAEHLDRVWHRRPEVGGRKVDYDFALSQQAGPTSMSLVMGPKWSNLHTSQTIGRVAEQFASGIANATEKAASRSGVNAGMWSSYLQKNKLQEEKVSGAANAQTSYVLDPEGSGFKYSAREQLYYDEQSAVFFTHVNARGTIAGTCFKYDCAAQLLVECEPREPYEPANSGNGNNSDGLINGAAAPKDVQQMQQAMQQQQEAMQQMQAMHNLQLQYMQMQMMMAQQGQQQGGPADPNMMGSMAATGMNCGGVSMGGMGMGMQSSAANCSFGNVNGGAVPGGFSVSGQGTATQRNKGKGRGKQIQLNLMQPSSGTSTGVMPAVANNFPTAAPSYHGSNHSSMQSGASYNSSNSSGVGGGGPVDASGASKWRVQQGDGKWVCTLCKRQFETLEHVLRHEQKSDLHRKNLEKESMAGA
eukprot:g15087.t1